MVTWIDVSFQVVFRCLQDWMTYAVAVVVSVQDLEWNKRLRALAGQELGAVGKGCVSELQAE